VLVCSSALPSPLLGKSDANKACTPLACRHGGRYREEEGGAYEWYVRYDAIRAVVNGAIDREVRQGLGPPCTHDLPTMLLYTRQA
jgi:hypothetical protein